MARANKFRHSSQWTIANWEECLSLFALAILAYKNPWKTERTRQLLEAKGIKVPEKHKDRSDPSDVDSVQNLEPEELEIDLEDL